MLNSFETLGLPNAIVRAIADLGFETPTAIQVQAVPPLLEGKTDLVALAQTGTGKTAAFGWPLLSLLDFNDRSTQALILCPTRELCIQITNDFAQFAKYTKDVRITAVYGGASIMNQISEIRKGAQIIVATPGRLVDLINRGKVNLNTIKYVVLDEADEMLNMGFKDDLDTILSETPNEKHTWLFSATMPQEVARISRQYMNKPMEITVGGRNEGNADIEHVYYIVAPRDKYRALKRIADAHPDIYSIVFCRTRRETQEIADALVKDGYPADALHGDLSQGQRDQVMGRFRKRIVQMLVATDVAARGIDVNDVTHVINYSLPDELESYTHRSGRTARAGKKGISMSLIGRNESSKIRTIERLVKQPFTQATLPTGDEVFTRKLTGMVERLQQTEVSEEIARFMPTIYDMMSDMDREDIIQRLVSAEMGRLLDYYRNEKDIQMPEAGGSNPDRGKRLFISLGKMDGLDKDSMKQLLVKQGGIPASTVLWIGVKDSYSLLEIAHEAADVLMQMMGQQRFNNRMIRMEERSGSGHGVGHGGGGKAGGFRKSYSKDKPYAKEKSYSKDFKSDPKKAHRKGSKPAFSSNGSKPKAKAGKGWFGE